VRESVGTEMEKSDDYFGDCNQGQMDDLMKKNGGENEIHQNQVTRERGLTKDNDQILHDPKNANKDRSLNDQQDAFEDDEKSALDEAMENIAKNEKVQEN